MDEAQIKRAAAEWHIDLSPPAEAKRRLGKAT